MKRELLMATAMLWATCASATETGHCDSKPFTLKKSAVTAPKAIPAPAPQAAAQPKPAAAPKKTVKLAKSGKSKPFVLGCKQPKS